jgi:hypothetical protein
MKASKATSERLIISQGAPWDGIVVMAESHESAETHDGVGHTSRHLVDDEVVDLTNVLAGRSVRKPQYLGRLRSSESGRYQAIDLE